MCPPTLAKTPTLAAACKKKKTNRDLGRFNVSENLTCESRSVVAGLEGNRVQRSLSVELLPVKSVWSQGLWERFVCFFLCAFCVCLALAVVVRGRRCRALWRCVCAGALRAFVGLSVRLVVALWWRAVCVYHRCGWSCAPACA